MELQRSTDMEIPRTNALSTSNLVSVFENHKGRHLCITANLPDHQLLRKLVSTYHPYISLKDDVVCFVDIDTVEIYPKTLERVRRVR